MISKECVPLAEVGTVIVFDCVVIYDIVSPSSVVKPVDIGYQAGINN
jgi:hypothetical protein